jgi:hypothetical protein
MADTDPTTKTPKMVKRAGEAFLDYLGGCVRLRNADTVIIEACIMRSQFDSAIKRALAEMLHPEPAMIDAGMDAVDSLTAAQVIAVWRAMVGAAQKE